jgi:hypothetical protein
MNAEYRSFRDFLGTLLALIVLAVALWLRDARWLLLAPLFGYGLAWIGHFAFERNRPATFQYSLYSVAGDFVMFKDMLLGRLP